MPEHPDIATTYDFIVCGAGSSGSVVAARLAENPEVSVLVLECAPEAERGGNSRFTAGAKPWIRFDEAGFRFSLNEDAMATEKLAEGIRLFFKDLRALRTLVQTSLEQTTRTEQRVVA